MSDEDASLAVLGRLAAAKAKSLGLTQSEIAQALGIDQSQVSRILAGLSRRRTAVFDAVCEYVNRKGGAPDADAVLRNRELLEAVAGAWDGSPEHSAALALVIRSLGALRSKTAKSAAHGDVRRSKTE